VTRPLPQFPATEPWILGPERHQVHAPMFHGPETSNITAIQQGNNTSTVRDSLPPVHPEIHCASTCATAPGQTIPSWRDAENGMGRRELLPHRTAWFLETWLSKSPSHASSLQGGHTHESSVTSALHMHNATCELIILLRSTLAGWGDIAAKRSLGNNGVG
jgi:hypothetical protein